MKLRRTFWLLSLVVMVNAFSALAAPQRMDEEQNEAQNAVTEIRIARRGCRGACPIDEVVLRSGGTAQYVGLANVEKIGTFIGKIQPRVFAKLVELVQPQEFFDVQQNFVAQRDAPSIVMTVVRSGASQSVIDSGDKAPLQIWSTEMAIFGVASQIQWKKIEMKGKSGVWGNVSMSPIHPVERIGQKNSAPKANAVLIAQTQDGKEAARTTTDKDGNFSLTLPPGDYIMVSGEKIKVIIGGMMPQQFIVKEKEWTKMAIDIDTGIR